MRLKAMMVYLYESCSQAFHLNKNDEFVLSKHNDWVQHTTPLTVCGPV